MLPRKKKYQMGSMTPKRKKNIIFTLYNILSVRRKKLKSNI